MSPVLDFSVQQHFGQRSLERVAHPDRVLVDLFTITILDVDFHVVQRVSLRLRGRRLRSSSVSPYAVWVFSVS